MLSFPTFTCLAECRNYISNPAITYKCHPFHLFNLNRRTVNLKKKKFLIEALGLLSSYKMSETISMTFCLCNELIRKCFSLEICVFLIWEKTQHDHRHVFIVLTSHTRAGVYLTFNIQLTHICTLIWYMTVCLHVCDKNKLISNIYIKYKRSVTFIFPVKQVVKMVFSSLSTLPL